MNLKENVLQLLEENKGSYISGEELARHFQVTRSAVWKVIKSLQEEGYQITGLRKKGYALSEDTNLLSAAAIGAVTIKIALAVVAAKVVLGKVVLPLIGTLVRTFLFALIVALLMLLQADITAWTIILPLILGVLIVSGLSDCAFGC